MIDYHALVWHDKLAQEANFLVLEPTTCLNDLWFSGWYRKLAIIKRRAFSSDPFQNIDRIVLVIVKLQSAGSSKTKFIHWYLWWGWRRSCFYFFLPGYRGYLRFCSPIGPLTRLAVASCSTRVKIKILYGYLKEAGTKNSQPHFVMIKPRFLSRISFII